MKLIHIFKKKFKNIIHEIDISENFNNLNVSVKFNNLPELNKDIIQEIIAGINLKYDEINLDISINDAESIQLENNEIEAFLSEVEVNREILEEINNCKINLCVNKRKIDNRVSIYDMEALGSYLENLKLSEVINNFYDLKKKNIYYFEIQQNIQVFSFSNLFCFIGLCDSIERKLGKNMYIKERMCFCNFLNGEEYQFEPDDFQFNDISNKKINMLLEKLKIVYSLISIFNFSLIKENYLELTLNGYKSIQFLIDFRDMDYQNMIIYYDIYKWVYSKENISDKIELTRNIISLYLNNSKSIILDSGVLEAIKSNYNIYLKDSVEKYFDVKSKAVEDILKMADDISDASKHIADSIMNNLKAMGTFIITVIIMNSLSDKKLQNIFTKDITGISIGLCLISLVYLWYTIKDTYNKRKEIITKYYRLKLSYNDILVKKDIDIIFKKDRLIKKDIKKLDNKIQYYTTIWISIIFIFISIIIVLRS